MMEQVVKVNVMGCFFFFQNIIPTTKLRRNVSCANMVFEQLLN